jgi:hypothetical protein
MLWKGIGTRYTSATAGHITPDIIDLVRVVQTNPQRAQFYANLINVLSFDDEGAEKGFTEEARWHPELAGLQFPNLVELNFYGFDAAMAMNSADAILHYLQPSIRQLHLGTASQLSDGFLDALIKSCPRLKGFHLGDTTESRISEDGIIRFVNNIETLQVLHLRELQADSWTAKVFMACARHPNLTYLAISEIQDEWTDRIDREVSDTRAFGQLKHFDAGISDHGLEMLAQYMPKLEGLSLHLHSLPGSYSILASASHFTRLTSLDIMFGSDSCITGSDLLLVTRSCPGLKELNISEFEGLPPSGVHITDDTIEEMAKNIPNMIYLCLVFDRSDLITWRSVLSFGVHCKKMQRLELACNVHWEEATTKAPANTFPELWSITFLFHGNNMTLGADRGKEEADSMISQIAAFAPQLTWFNVRGGSQADDEFARAVNVVTNPRFIPRVYSTSD